MQTENTKNYASSKVSDYYSYLQKNYDSMSKGNVTISSKYLEKCAGYAEKAKELDFTIKYVEANSELEAQAMMQKEKPDDTYYPKFNVGI